MDEKTFYRIISPYSLSILRLITNEYLTPTEIYRKLKKSGITKRTIRNYLRLYKKMGILASNSYSYKVKDDVRKIIRLDGKAGIILRGYTELVVYFDFEKLPKNILKRPIISVK